MTDKRTGRRSKLRLAPEAGPSGSPGSIVVTKRRSLLGPYLSHHETESPHDRYGKIAALDGLLRQIEKQAREIDFEDLAQGGNVKGQIKRTFDETIDKAIQAEDIASYIAYRVLGGEKPDTKDFRLALLVYTSLCQKIPALERLSQAQAQSASALKLPSEAPALWKSDKQPSETPPDFIRRVYAPWLGHGLTRADIKHLDEPLYRSLYKWLSNSQNEMPDDLDLPTLSQQNDRTLARLEAGEAVGEFTMREMGRVRSAMQRRTGKDR